MKNIYTKLLKVTSNIEKLEKDKKNPFFKSSYVSLDNVIDVARPHLLAEKLLLLQPIEQGNVGTRIVDTESGESVDSFIPLPENVKPQDLGSCITYFRRYTLVSLLGLSQEDDDGNKAQGRVATNKITNTRTSAQKDAMLDSRIPF